MPERDYETGYRAPDGHFEVRFARQGDIVFSITTGRGKDEDADILARLHRDWEKEIGKPYRYIMDITNYEGEDPNFRKKMQHATLGPDSPLACFAIVGGNFAVRAMFNIIGKVSKVPMKMFATEKEALDWAKEK